MPSYRLFLWSLFSVLLLTGSPKVWAQEEMEEVPSPQRRQLWDFFSFVSLLARLGPPCTRGDGTPDWGPQRGPRWNDCSKEESPTQAPSSLNNANGVSSYESYVDANGNTVYAGQGADSAGGKFSNAAAGLNLWMVFVAGSVMSALVAVHLGQKKDSVGEGRHGMSGAIMRRKGAVGAFADGVFPSRGKEVEMKSSSRPEYRLDMSEQV